MVQVGEDKLLLDDARRLVERARAALTLWAASASIDGAQPVAHLIPLSLPWIDERVVVAAPAQQPTARNIAEHGKVRLALGPTRDVVIIDAALERLIGVAEVPEDFAERYAAQADWDPRQQAQRTRI